MCSQPKTRWPLRIALACSLVACACSREADFSGGGTLFDGQSLGGWRPLSGAWSVSDGAILGVGPRARIVCQGTYPAAYRLRFDVASHGSPEVSWAVAVPVGESIALCKGLLYFAGKPHAWADAWQTVEVSVHDGTLSFALPGLVPHSQGQAEQKKAVFADLERAHALSDKGLRVCVRQDGLAVLAPPLDTWRLGTISFEEVANRGQQCLEGRFRGIALVVPCTAIDDTDVAPNAGARFRNIVVESLE